MKSETCCQNTVRSEMHIAEIVQRTRTSKRKEITAHQQARYVGQYVALLYCRSRIAPDIAGWLGYNYSTLIRLQFDRTTNTRRPTLRSGCCTAA